MDKNEIQTVAMYAYRIIQDKQQIVAANGLSQADADDLTAKLTTLFNWANTQPGVETGVTLS